MNSVNSLPPLNRRFRPERLAVFSAILISVAVVFFGCMRYSFSGAVPTHLKTVAVPLVGNQTAEYGIAERITDQLIASIQQDNTLKIADENTADAVLRATLLKIEDVPYTYSGATTGVTQSVSVGEYRLTLVLKIEYYDQTKSQRIWEQEFRNWGTYDHQTGAPEERDEGFTEAIDKLAEDVLNQMVSGW